MDKVKRGRWSSHPGACLCLVGAVLFTGVMLVLTHLPNSKVPPWIVRWGDDKFRHVVAYGIWACLVLGSSRLWSASRGRALVGVLFGAAVLAAMDELSQPRFGRTASVWDYAASMLGAAIGCAVFLAWEVWRIGRATAPMEVPVRRSEEEPLQAVPRGLQGESVKSPKA